MRKKLALFCSIMALLLVVTACGSGGANSSANSTGSTSPTQAAETEQPSTPAKKTKLTWIYWNNEDTVKAFLDLAKEKLPDIEIEFQYVENKNYDQVVRTKLLAGEGPDLISSLINDNTVKLGYFEDLTEKYGNLYQDAGKKQYTINGKLYGLPQVSFFNGYFYNVEIFEKYNLKVPTTMNEFYEIAETLKKNGVKPLTNGYKNPSQLAQSFISMAITEYYSTPEGKSFDDNFRLGTAKMADALSPSLTQWTEMVKRGIVTMDMLGLEDPQALDEFASGKAAMYKNGPWNLEAIKKKNPNIKLDMFPQPNSAGGVGWLTGGAGFSFGINANSKVKDEAYRVLDLVSTPEGQEALAAGNLGGQSYLNGVVLPVPDDYKSSFEAFKAGHVYFPPASWGSLKDPIFKELGIQLQGLVAGATKPEDVLKNVDNKADELRSK
ncbi:ABC transporter substrate-binding protein [Cohnella silvisoli]|uniref:Extracellular solute-binding protein n=1 Tax=Cohnella silvisoli TaxID=2873699 RepID=A0ABV1L2X7_9BACL|nr:extracellular solute-binding protein [Cohnella silvisoli]MCD9025854.1 extracellular solute-binding protein [Cohnella silvisoli]